MSYRLIDSNAIADKYPEVNDMPCVFADLPNGLDGSFIDIQPVVHGKWKKQPFCIVCSECGESFPLVPQNYCPNCGAFMQKEGDRNE